MPSPLQIEFTNLESPLDNSAELIQKIRTSLSREPTTKNIEVKAIKILPNKKVKVFVETRKQAENLMEHNEWTHVIDACRVVDKILFPIKMDNVNRNHVFDVAGNISEDFYSAIGEKNTCAVPKAVWLSGKKTYGSLIAYVKQQKATDRLLKQGYATIKGELVTTTPYEQQLCPIRCHNCQEYSVHKAARCKKEAVCGNCAGRHATNSCDVKETKCHACSGPHRVSDPTCPRWMAEKQRMRRTCQINPNTTHPSQTEIST
ncbi:hypothetical protein N7535_005467 [Penicillium sp. DV-2018c]|nr:hypothetical protein N7535_005467 [Penicillium sp. DV-2018c]